jgi:glycosyltransferase involved in cell wall biosynthesis
MPAYNSALTLLHTYNTVMTQEVVDAVVIVDDCSVDNTYEVAKKLPKACVRRHESNLGYGGNQKTCYRTALEIGANVVIMVHPDYQYTPDLIPAMAGMIVSGVYDCVLGSRTLCGGALRGGMPVWKFVFNRLLTAAENLLLHASLSEYHTGYRGFSRRLLESIEFGDNSNDFIFDNQMLAQILWAGMAVG